MLFVRRFLELKIIEKYFLKPSFRVQDYRRPDTYVPIYTKFHSLNRLTDCKDGGFLLHNKNLANQNEAAQHELSLRRTSAKFDLDFACAVGVKPIFVPEACPVATPSTPTAAASSATTTTRSSPPPPPAAIQPNKRLQICERGGLKFGSKNHPGATVSSVSAP